MSGERRQREVFVSSSGPWWGQVTANPQGETGPAASRNQPPAARSEPQSRTSPQSAGKPQSGAGCGSLSVTTAGSGARGGVGLGRKRLVTRGIAVRAPGTPLASLGPPVAPTVHAGPGARWRVPVPRPRPRDDSRAWASERAGWGTGRHGRGAGAARTKPALTPQSPGRPEWPGLGASPGSSVTHWDPSSLSASSSHGWLPKAPASLPSGHKTRPPQGGGQRRGLWGHLGHWAWGGPLEGPQSGLVEGVCTRHTRGARGREEDGTHRLAATSQAAGLGFDFLLPVEALRVLELRHALPDGHLGAATIQVVQVGPGLL